jgi:glycosyltransferase involved in cell wall biosynthesis
VAGFVNVQAGIAAWFARIPVVWQVTDTATPVILVKLLAPLVERLSSHLMFNGGVVRKVHFRHRCPRVPWSHYLPPVRTDTCRPSAEHRTKIRATLDISQGTVVIGMVANINPQKGIEYFIHCAARMLSVRRDVVFICVGGEQQTHRGYARWIYQLAHSLGLNRDRLIFAGAQQDVHRWYSAFDINVISSTPASEGTTTTGMEAAACGVPVVATDVGGVREVVHHQRTGIVVPPGDVESMGSALKRLIDSPALRHQLSLEARRRAVSEFDVESCADSHLHAFLSATQAI